MAEIGTNNVAPESQPAQPGKWHEQNQGKENAAYRLHPALVAMMPELVQPNTTQAKSQKK